MKDVINMASFFGIKFSSPKIDLTEGDYEKGHKKSSD